MAVENITLNLIPTGDTPSIHAAQYDVERPFTIKLKEGADDFTPTGYDIELQVRKVDNNIVTAVPVSTSGNVVTFNTTQQMTACSGTNLAELQLSKDDQTIATLHFYLVVQRDVLAGGLTSQSEIYDLEEQIAAIVPEVIGDEYYTAEEVDEKIAEIPTFDPTNYYTKSQLYTKTETNGFLAQKANTSSLAAVATSGSYNDLLNKPTIPDVSNYYKKSETYNQTEVNNLLSTKADTISLSTVATSGSYNDLLNKPSIPAAQVQSDWSQSDNTKVDYIKNKPTIPTNAEQLPIESGSATNTKDYIDTGLSGKADTSDLALKQDKAILHIKKDFNNTYTIQTCIGALISEYGKNTMAFGFVLTGSGWYEGMLSFYDANQGGGYLIMNGATPRLWAVSYQNGTVNITEK